MSTETAKKTPPLANVSNKEDFKLPLPGVSFMHQGIVQDLRKIDRHTAEVLANDERVQFIVWAPNKGPNAKPAAEPAPPQKGK